MQRDESAGMKPGMGPALSQAMSRMLAQSFCSKASCACYGAQMRV